MSVENIFDHSVVGDCVRKIETDNLLLLQDGDGDEGDGSVWEFCKGCEAV